MGIKDKLANIDVSGLTSVFKRDDDGENDGLRGGKGGGAHSGLGYTKDGGLSRGPWQRFDSGDGSSSDGGVGMLLYLTRGSQVFCLLVALFIDAHMLTAQKKWDVGPSSLVVFSLFVLILSVLSAAMMLLLPIVHEKTGKMRDISRGLRQLRPSFLINAINTSLMLIMAFTLTISANSKGCKNPENDPNAEKEGYLENGLPGFCRDKRALTAFLWLAFISWLVSLFFTLKAWRRSRSAPTIPAFRPPAEEEVKDGGSDSGDLESSAQRYDSVPEPPMSIPYNASASSPLSGSPYGVGGFQAHAAARQSGTFYEGGRPFDDPTPTGYGSSPYSNPYESQASPAYEDPYDRIRRERGA